MALIALTVISSGSPGPTPTAQNPPMLTSYDRNGPEKRWRGASASDNLNSDLAQPSAKRQANAALTHPVYLPRRRDYATPRVCRSARAGPGERLGPGRKGQRPDRQGGPRRLAS